ncbi:MAG: FAD-dependent oxidoreductase [Myxococcales bacterium]|nr:FAD-dependent oxidoreductase [Myxococcales bacterium]
MRVAIVGGGAAGLVTAYLLSGRHELTVFEAGSTLGGHVRTLQGNVRCERLAPGLFLDAGVVEFDEHHFPSLGRLLDTLGVERRTAPGSTALFLQDGRHFRSPGNIDLGGGGRFERLTAKTRLLPIARQKRQFERRTEGVSMADLYARPVGDYLDGGTYATWLRMLLMYAYSTPYPETAAIPAALAVPMLRAFTRSAKWTAIEGGTWEYLRRITEALEAKLVLDARIDAISRPQGAVEIRMQNGEVLTFDAVVLAAPPDQVLELLADPTPGELRRFAAWRANPIQTVIHTDTAIYGRRGARYYSEFDLFEGSDGGAGYNAYLNRLAGLPPDHATPYFLADGLGHEIDPACVVHEQPHHTPRYTVDALRHREEVFETQGELGTFHAGAWLGNGLHEGAVASAVGVSLRLGGRRL